MGLIGLICCGFVGGNVKLLGMGFILFWMVIGLIIILIMVLFFIVVYCVMI